MSAGVVRLALVGFGSIARCHAEVFRAQGAEIVAACNRSESGRARAIADGIGVTFDDTCEMVESVQPDGLILCASALSQFDVACALIPYSIPILLEKPPGTSTAEALHLAGLVDRWDVPVMVGLNRRFYSVFRRAITELGGIDAITSVHVEWSENPQAARDTHGAQVVPRLVFCNSLHGLDLLSFFGGAPGELMVFGRDLDDSQSYRWQMSATGLSERGVCLGFRSTWDSPVAWRLVLKAPGTRVVASPLETALVTRRSGESQHLDCAPEDLRYKPGFFGQAEAFLKVVRDGVPVRWPAASLHCVLPVMRLAERLTNACTRYEVEDSRPTPRPMAYGEIELVGGTPDVLRVGRGASRRRRFPGVVLCHRPNVLRLRSDLPGR